MKEIIVTSSANIQIAANHYELGGRDSVIVVCPGCFMSKDARSFLALSEDLFRKYDVITMDFRGHGRSNGLFSFTVHEKYDLKAIIDHVKVRYSQIHIVGFSLGAATALLYAAENKDVNSVIAVSAPADFDRIENRFWGSDAVIPAIKKFEPGKSPTIRPGNIFLKKTKPIDAVTELSPIPVMFITGSKDPIIFPHHSKELFEKAEEPKKLKIIEAGIHAEELYVQNPERFVETCLEWIKKTSLDRG